MSLFVLPNTLFADPVIFDFVGFALDAEHGAMSKMFTVDGVTVTASAYELTDPTNTHFMYLDDASSGPGGPGVCQQLDGSAQCDPSSDDNITLGEVLVLTFSQEVSIAEILFSNGGHEDLYGGDFGLAIDGSVPNDNTDFVGFSPGLFTGAFNPTPGSLTGTTFYFIAPATMPGQSIDDEDTWIYISSLSVTTVREPSTFLLLGSGLFVGVAIRKRLP